MICPETTSSTSGGTHWDLPRAALICTDIQGVPHVQAKAARKIIYNAKMCIIILQTPCFEHVQDIDCGWQLVKRRI
jgi:hypothetical protein